MHIPTLAFVHRLASAPLWTQPGRPLRVSPLMLSSLEAADPKVNIMWTPCLLMAHLPLVLKAQGGSAWITNCSCLQSSLLENVKLGSSMGFENGTAEVLGERDWS